MVDQQAAQQLNEASFPAPDGLRPAPPDVLAVVGRLIARDFPDLATRRIAVLVRETALRVAENQVTVAATGVSTSPDDPFDCVFWFAWDVWQLLTDLEREAIVFHELMHCDQDEMGKGMLAPHDAAIFNEEVKRYGLWWERPTEVFKSINTRKGERG